jgi:membrane protease YdiL (CAAX protease family)
LLVFVLGIWLWDHYFGKPQGYEPGTEQIALVKLDRDLRLADVMEGDPAWLRWLAGVDDPATARENALGVLQNLSGGQAISFAGLEAYAILKAAHEELPAREVLAEVMQGRMLSDFAETSDQLAEHGGTWWHARLIEDWEKTSRPVRHWRDSFGRGAMRLRSRAIMARSSVWLIGLAGLAFLPGTLASLFRGLRAKSTGYGGAWPLPLGVTVFLVTTLAWIGFTMVLEIGIANLPALHPVLGIFLDAAARLLPPLIALGLLFRRPSHAARVLGLNRPFHARTILGLFTLLMIIDQALRALLGGGQSTEPGGGLSAGDAGLWGLAFAIISACLLAPVAEEVVYRGVLFRSCWNRLGVLPAAVISSAVFAVLHFYGGYGLASVAIFGFSCALLYAATGSLGSCVALHILYNSSIKIPEWLIYHGPLG